MRVYLKCPNVRRSGAPCCGRIAPIEAGTAATVSERRKCRRCKTTWQVTVRPIGAMAEGQGFMHQADWTAL